MKKGSCHINHVNHWIVRNPQKFKPFSVTENYENEKGNGWWMSSVKYVAWTEGNGY